MARRSKLAKKGSKPSPSPARARAKRKRRSEPARAPSYRRNPAVDWTETAKQLGYGAAGFAVSRFATRVAAVQVAKWKPDLAKHAGVGAGILSFLAALFLAKRTKYTDRYANEITLGTGIALAQTLIQTYLPQLGWMVSDASADQVAAAAATQAKLAAPQSTGLLPDDEDDDVWGGYNDAYDHGRFAGQRRRHHQAQTAGPQTNAAPAPAQPIQPTASPEQGDTVEDLLAELDNDQGGGVFSN